MNITNIVIDYKNEDEVVNYAQQLAKQTVADNITLIVVVNASENRIQYLEKKLKEIKLKFKTYHPKENLGYINGMVYGFDKCKNNDEWFVLSNTDIVFDNIYFFERFMGSSESKDLNKWVIGPDIYAVNSHTYSNPYMSIRPNRQYYSIRNIAMKFPLIYECIFNLKKKIKKRKIQTSNRRSSYVYAVHGSFFFVRKELLEQLLKDKRWELLYDEEQYIAENVRKSKKKVFFLNSIQVRHIEGTSTGKIALRKRYARSIKSNKRILKDYY